jgi:hypothetical protein
MAGRFASTNLNSGHTKMEEKMSKENFIIALAFAGICAVATLPAWAEETDTALLAQSLSTVRVTLDQGLKASEAQGKPISGKFELEHGAVQLSVYVTKSGKFSEVIVDNKSGSIKKAETITDSDDLKTANEQSQAITKAKVSLEKAVRDAVRANPGYRAVRVMPTLNAGHPIAEITLMKGTEAKKVSKQLD